MDDLRLRLSLDGRRHFLDYRRWLLRLGNEDLLRILDILRTASILRREAGVL